MVRNSVAMFNREREMKLIFDTNENTMPFIVNPVKHESESESESESEPLYGWWFTVNQFVLATTPSDSRPVI
jgi:hypothetical protein